MSEAKKPGSGIVEAVIQLRHKLHQYPELSMKETKTKQILDGAIFYIGTGEAAPALNTKEYDFNDGIIGTAIGMFRQLAQRPEEKADLHS